MNTIDFENAYYIKLGAGGQWEADSLQNGRARVGWGEVELELIAKRDWETIEQRIRQKLSDKPQYVVSADLNALRRFCESEWDDVWITFYQRKLWWCRLKKDRDVKEDETSKYREVDGGWSNRDIEGAPLYTNRVSGRLAKIQRFPGTLCRVHEAEYLKRLLNAQQSPTQVALGNAKAHLIDRLAEAIQTLHWREFELLADLVFRQSGWRRVSETGGTMESVDLELEDPITGDRYQVQVKSSASRRTFDDCVQEFSGIDFRKLYFVVHSPDADLAGLTTDTDEQVQILGAQQLAEMVLDGGLVDWVLERTR